MAFEQVLAEFFVNFILAAFFAALNAGLFYLAGWLVKIDDNTILKSFAFGIYTGIVSLVLAYLKSSILTIFFIFASVFVIKFIYEFDWKDKKLYFSASIWAIFIVLFMALLYWLIRTAL